VRAAVGRALAFALHLAGAGCDLVAGVAAVLAVVAQPAPVDFFPAACFDLVESAFVAAVRAAAVVVERPAVDGFVPAVAILSAVAGFDLVVYFDLDRRAGLCLGLAACFALVAAARTVDSVAVALCLYLDDLVAVRKLTRMHQKRTVKCLFSQIE